MVVSYCLYMLAEIRFICCPIWEYIHDISGRASLSVQGTQCNSPRDRCHGAHLSHSPESPPAHSSQVAFFSSPGPQWSCFFLPHKAMIFPSLCAFPPPPQALFSFPAAASVLALPPPASYHWLGPSWVPCLESSGCCLSTTAHITLLVGAWAPCMVCQVPEPR